MSWKSLYRKRFFHDLASLPPEVRIEIESSLRKEIQDPFSFSNLKKLKGASDKYRLRFGNYRVGITIDKKAREILFERAAHRSAFYKLFP
jgi:mRNA interferase RelE/StbE